MFIRYNIWLLLSLFISIVNVTSNICPSKLILKPIIPNCIEIMTWNWKWQGWLFLIVYNDIINDFKTQQTFNDEFSSCFSIRPFFQFCTTGCTNKYRWGFVL